METRNKSHANDLFREGKYNEALEIYSELLTQDMDNFQILSNRASTYLKLKKYLKARDDCIRCICLDSTSGKIWGKLGASLYGLGNYQNSLLSYKIASEYDPTNLIYQDMIIDINAKIALNEKLDSMCVIDLFAKMTHTIIEKPEILEKIISPSFQTKVFGMMGNPSDAIKDEEIIQVLMSMINED